MFDTRSSEHQDSSALLKLELDNTLKKLSDAHAAVIHNVESIPGQAAMILHAYCDNDNAPFKQVCVCVYMCVCVCERDKLIDSPTKMFYI